MEIVFAEVSRRTLEYVSQNAKGDLSEDFNLDVESIPHFEKKVNGKVRDIYICKDCIVLVTTNRQSAFDRLLCTVPSKGKVTSDISAVLDDKIYLTYNVRF
jgi:hypothetical protein